MKYINKKPHKITIWKRLPKVLKEKKSKSYKRSNTFGSEIDMSFSASFRIVRKFSSRRSFGSFNDFASISALEVLNGSFFFKKINIKEETKRKISNNKK